MVGDRYLTDVVYSNRHGMLTIRPTPLTLVGETFVVRMVRTSPYCWDCCQCDVRHAWSLSSLSPALIPWLRGSRACRGTVLSQTSCGCACCRCGEQRGGCSPGLRRRGKTVCSLAGMHWLSSCVSAACTVRGSYMQ